VALGRSRVIERPDQVRTKRTKCLTPPHVASVDHHQRLDFPAVCVRADPVEYLVDIRRVGELKLVTDRSPRAPEVDSVNRLHFPLDVAGIDPSNVHAPILRPRRRAAVLTLPVLPNPPTRPDARLAGLPDVASSGKVAAVVSLQPIDGSNRGVVEALSVASIQKQFVVGVADSLVEAVDDPGGRAIHWVIYAEDIPVGL
jgi:hypothetical protein